MPQPANGIHSGRTRPRDKSGDDRTTPEISGHTICAACAIGHDWTGKGLARCVQPTWCPRRTTFKDGSVEGGKDVVEDWPLADSLRSLLRLRLMDRPVQPGVLYVVGTPIGNLEDITLRALRILKEVATVAAEDTRHTQKLLARYDLHTPLTSYHDFNKETKAAVLLARLQEGASIALVCDAGTPTISDPGYFLINRCIEAGVAVVPIPGPSAILGALSASGLPTDRFHFEGFLPKPSGRLAKRLAALRGLHETIVLFESPHRILKTLKAIREAWGDRPAVLARELTKLHEEFVRGTLSRLIAELERQPRRGEVTLLIGGLDRASSSDAIDGHEAPAIGSTTVPAADR